MKSAPIKYGTRFGCRWGMPHDFTILHEAKGYKIEKCTLCSVRRRYNKGFKGRVANVQYLQDHVRKFAQKFGSTKRVYYKIYHPEKTIIHI